MNRLQHFLNRLLSTETAEHVVQSTRRVLVVGLGNYTHPKSRHSVGQILLDSMVLRNSLDLPYCRSCKGYVASYHHEGLEIFLLKPRHYMNNNGKSVLKAVKFLNVNPSNVLLLHDELDLSVGKYKIKHGGSANGHHGVQDTQERLKFTSFKRMRIGIGRPENKADVSDFVLENFSQDELGRLNGLMDNMIDLTHKTLLTLVETLETEQESENIQ